MAHFISKSQFLNFQLHFYFICIHICGDREGNKNKTLQMFVFKLERFDIRRVQLLVPEKEKKKVLKLS